MKRRTFLSFLAATLSGVLHKGLVRASTWLAHGLRSDTLDTLLAVVRTLLEVPVGIDHYREFFEFRSGRVPKYLELYERFESYLNQLARSRFKLDFMSCDPGQRRKVLETFRREYSRGSPTDKKWIARYHDHVVLEILQLYANTDAWVSLGYDYWPGDPVGLDAYTRAVGKAGR